MGRGGFVWSDQTWLVTEAVAWPLRLRWCVAAKLQLSGIVCVGEQHGFCECVVGLDW